MIAIYGIDGTFIVGDDINITFSRGGKFPWSIIRPVLVRIQRRTILICFLRPCILQLLCRRYNAAAEWAVVLGGLGLKSEPTNGLSWGIL
jgi:hypothetical protein